MVDLQDINGDGKLDLFYVLIDYPNPNSPVVYRLNQLMEQRSCYYECHLPINMELQENSIYRPEHRVKT